MSNELAIPDAGPAHHYRNAPITEAVIDFQISPQLDRSRVEPVYSEIQKEFPERRERLTVSGGINVGESLQTYAEQRQIGFIAKSTAQDKAVSIRTNGFAFSRLRPYTNWADVRTEARSVWEIYNRIVRPDRITRVAVRYVNQIDIPQREIDFKDYFRTSPEISPSLPQGLSGFLMHLELPQSDLQAMLVLNQSLVPVDPSEERVSVILDLDLFRGETEFAPATEDVWDLLEHFRTRKNVYFEGCITDAARRLFD